MKVICLNIQLVPSLKVWMSCYWDMSTFVGTSPFFRRALYVAMETMPFHIAQMGFYSLGQYFSPFKWSPKTIWHTLEVFLMVQGQFNWTLGYSGMCIFSSPEPKAPRWAISIPVTPASVVRPSSVRPSSVRPSVHPSTFSNIFSSETTGPIELKFHMETP